MGRQVDVDDLIDSRRVAELLGLSQHNSVGIYRRRYKETFPAPAVDMGAGRCLLWVRQDVEDWHRSRVTRDR